MSDHPTYSMQTGVAVIEARIAPLPQWYALPAAVLFLASIFGYAVLVVLAYT